MQEDILSVLKDSDFLKKVIKMNMEEAQKAFADRGIKLSTKDMLAIKNLVILQVEKPNEISEDTFKKISGGISVETTKKIKNISFAIASLVLAGTTIYAAKELSTATAAAKNTMTKVDQTVDQLKSPENKGMLWHQFMG